LIGVLLSVLLIGVLLSVLLLLLVSGEGLLGISLVV